MQYPSSICFTGTFGLSMYYTIWLLLGFTTTITTDNFRKYDVKERKEIQIDIVFPVLVIAAKWRKYMIHIYTASNQLDLVVQVNT